LEHRLAKERAVKGIPIDENIWREIAAIVDRLGVPYKLDVATNGAPPKMHALSAAAATKEVAR
jgi:hypothetical protein